MIVGWTVLERRLDALFVPSCDPYLAGAAVLLGKPTNAITQDDRDVVKRVFMRMRVRHDEVVQNEGMHSLRHASDKFHEVVAALAAEDLLADNRNAIVAEKLRESLRSRDQIKRIAADGFELCVRALAAALGATGVTIHECGDQALGEQPWSGGDDD